MNVIETIRTALQEDRLALFIGAGLSSRSYPKWRELTERIAKEANVPFNPDIPSYETVLADCQTKLERAKWLQLIADQYSERPRREDVDPAYKLLTRIPARVIITTNFDSLPELLWSDRDIFVPTKDELATLMRRSAEKATYSFLLKLHGTQTRPDTMIVTESDYERVMHQDIHILEYLRIIIGNRRLLFIGCGMQDPNLLLFLSRSVIHLKDFNPIGYALLPEKEIFNLSGRLKRHNVEPIPYIANGNDHSNLKEILSQMLPSSQGQQASGFDSLEPLPLNVETRLAHANAASSLANAFPLQQPTRLFYTCRGVIDNAPEECPESGENTRRSPYTLLTHIPVDELESVAICIDQYSSSLIRQSENKVGEMAVCSNAPFGLQLNLGHALETDGRINECLLENLLVVGENSVSNRLLQLASYVLPWVHYVVRESAVGCPARPPSVFQVRSLFRNLYGHHPDHHPFECAEEDVCKAIITYLPNPFAPDDRKILMLVGCRRPGQYLLLEWLRHASNGTFREITKHFCTETALTTQILISGVSKQNSRERKVLRHWDYHVIRDITSDRPFFSVSEKKIESAPPGTAMCDLSLLGLISKDEEVLQRLIGSMPIQLKKVFVFEKFGDESGLHVTLFEFIHHLGPACNWFARHLLNGEAPLLACIKELGKMPQPRMRLRQARVTRWSLQVLADLYWDPGDFLKLFAQRDSVYFHQAIGPMDIIVSKCNLISEEIDLREKSMLNLMRAPYPLHVTLHRFTSDFERSAGIAWANEHRLTIWGASSGLKLALTHAKKVPFDDVEIFPL